MRAYILSNLTIENEDSREYTELRRPAFKGRHRDLFLIEGV
jgi:hypothetical protein